jgi:GT2 family glycosyltransferase
VLGRQPTDPVDEKMSAVHSLVYTVILTHNHCADTLQALDSLCQMAYPNQRLLLVDNHSSDGTVERVRADYPEVELLVHSDNLGFSAGMNSGLRHALGRGADHVLIINNDVVADPSMLTFLVESMGPSVGAVAPTIYYWDDPSRIWSSGFSMHPLFLEMRGGSRGTIDHGQRQEPFEVGCLLGCALLLNGSMLRDIGLLDERYFFYYEDLDLCLRARQQGYRLMTVPAARLWHKVASSAGMGSAFRVYQMARGNTILYRTHARGLQKPIGFLIRVGSTVKKIFQFLATGQFDLLLSYGQGIVDGWRTPPVGRDRLASDR